MHQDVARKLKDLIAQVEIALPPRTPKWGGTAESEPFKSVVDHYIKLQYEETPVSYNP